MKGIELFGKDWKKVQQYVGTRTSAQARSHAQKVLAKTNPALSSPIKSSSPKFESPADDSFEDCLKRNKIDHENTISTSNNFKQLEAATLKPAQVGGEQIPVQRVRPHSSLDASLDDIVQNHKRKCTFDVGTKYNDESLMIENDEVSQKLLRKLTTPKQVPRLMSCSYSNVERFALKFEFDSDIESMNDDVFDQKSACAFPSLNDFVADVIEDAYL